MGLAGLKSGCQQGCAPPGGPRGALLSLPFPAPGHRLHSLALRLLLHLQSWQYSNLSPPVSHPSVVVAPSLDLFGTLGITQIMKANLTISESLI